MRNHWLSRFILFLFLQIVIFAGLTDCRKEPEPPMEEAPKLTDARGTLIGQYLPQLPKQVFWSRTGDEIIVRCSPGIYAINIETDSTRIINEDLKSIYARYSLDGKYLYYVSKGEYKDQYAIGRLDLNDGTAKILVENSVAGPLIISKDHDKVAFLKRNNPEPTTYIYRESTDDIQPVTTGIPRSFNTEGTKMIIRNENDEKIYLVDLDDHNKVDLNLNLTYDYRYFWNEDEIFVLGNGRIRDVFNKTSKTTNLTGVLGRSWTRSMTFDYNCLNEVCDSLYVTYYLINDNPYLKQKFAMAIAFNFGYPTFAPDEQHAAYIINNKVYICKLPF